MASWNPAVRQFPFLQQPLAQAPHVLELPPPVPVPPPVPTPPPVPLPPPVPVVPLHLNVVALHTLPEVLVQSTQAWPAVPQVVLLLLVLVTQALPLQQPVTQFTALHVAAPPLLPQEGTTEARKPRTAPSASALKVC